MGEVAFILLGLVSWLLAFAAPPVTAWWFWNKAPLRFGYLLPPIVYLPLIFSIQWLIVRVIFFAAHDEGDGPPGLGLALIPVALILILTVSVYYLATMARAVRMRRNGS